MIYYRVRREFDGCRTQSGAVLVKNELLTAKELEKNMVDMRFVKKVEVSQKNIYVSFGARFENGTDHNTNMG